ncbi:MAG: hypothetical protein ACKO4U_19130 [Caldilinea sp.]
MIAQPPLTNLQMELLKLYSLRLSDEQLLGGSSKYWRVTLPIG